ncbi:MAG: glycosyltransferase [Bacteroidetes bacterium]|nr:glycosyltransferase [Bacteroidota bacterium]
MKILQITKKFPHPVKDGEVIGIINLTKGFAAQGHEVTVLSLNTKKHYFPPENLPEDEKSIAKFISVDIDTTLHPLKAFLNLFTSKSYNIERFYSTDFENKIAEVLATNSFDLILLEGIYLMRYIEVIRKNTAARVLLRPQNVEFIIWERLYRTEKHILKRMYLKVLSHRMKQFEISNLNLADIMIPVSENDMKIFLAHGCTVPHTSIPTGYIFDTLPLINSNEENVVAFIGGMDWMPNREGVEWFIQKVWTQVVAEIPDAKFYLAGRNFPDEIRNLKVKGLIIVGEVNDAVQFISSKSISIVPLFAGSGMRVKIIEAMALGRAVISTSVGAESLAFTDGKDILIADDANTFAQAVIKTLSDHQLRMDLGANAQQLIRNQYDNRKICSAIIDFCKPYLN